MCYPIFMRLLAYCHSLGLQIMFFLWKKLIFEQKLLLINIQQCSVYYNYVDTIHIIIGVGFWWNLEDGNKNEQKIQPLIIISARQHLWHLVVLFDLWLSFTITTWLVYNCHREKSYRQNPIMLTADFLIHQSAAKIQYPYTDSRIF